MAVKVTTKNLRDIFKTEVINAYVEKIASNDIPYLGEALFPSKRVNGLELKWIVGANGLPVALKPSALDAKATIRDRVGFHEISTQMPFFREGNQMGEQARQELLQLVRADDQGAIARVLDTEYKQIKGLIDGAKVQEERMRMQLLSSGKIEISANNIPYVYDYTGDSEFKTENMGKLLTTNRWSETATADPFKDIQDIQLKFANKGIKLSRAICSSKVLGYLRNNAKLKMAINGANRLDSGLAITNKQIKQFFKDELDLTIQEYDKQFKDELGADKRFFPEEIFTMIPDGALGSTCKGTTPEEASKVFGSDLDITVREDGIAILEEWDAHTIQSKEIVSEVVLPSFEAMNQIYILTVHSA